MSGLKKYYFGKKKIKYGEQFVFSTYKINPTAVYPAQIRNSSGVLLDVGFDGSGIVDTSVITSHASGSNAEFSRMYDQYSKIGHISVEQATTSPNPRPLCTSTLFNGLNYWRDTTQSAGLWKFGNLPIAMNKDYVVNYVFRNETQPNNQRFNFLIRTDLIGHQGILGVGIRPSGANYIVGIKYIYANRVLANSDITYFPAVGNTSTTFTLYTFSYIQGVFTFYRNGVVITTTTSPESLANSTSNGVYIGIGSSAMDTNIPNGNVVGLGGKINDFKTLSLYTGENLSSFNIVTYMNTFKTIHGII